MGCRPDYAINGITSACFGSGLDVPGYDWWRNFFKNVDGFSLS